MLATLADAPLDSPHLIYEPKYDGIRAIVDITPGADGHVRLWSRLGNEKTAQFPDLVAALTGYAKSLKAPVVLDGEIVALNEAGDPAGFQRLQSRIHLTDAKNQALLGKVAFIAFDILRDGNEDLRPLPLTVRRKRLEKVFRPRDSARLRLSEVSPGNGHALYRRALERGWEGLVAKESSSIYHTGKRTRDWCKLKIVQEQEFVVGGWTEPRTGGRPFGALLLGYYTAGQLEYAGHTGSGFDQRELERVSRLLKPREIAVSPFRTRPRTNERPHWAKPELVAQLRFTEWTDEGFLRHPIYLGLRDDVKPETVRREIKAGATGPVSPKRAMQRAAKADAAGANRRRPARGAKRSSASERGRVPSSGKEGATGLSPVAAPAAKGDATGPVSPKRTAKSSAKADAAKLQDLVDQLTEIERGPDAGRLRLPGGASLEVSNLRKVFWPELKITKGDLLRYYVRVSPFLLPVVQDRPLILKRFPNGISAQAFYQQRAPDKVPPGIRIETVPGDKEVPSRLIGGDLATLLYIAQLAAISQDPWFSRVQSPGFADQCAIDLDPMPGVTFARVLDVARWVRDELDTLRVTGFPKTSGASGLHIFIPLRPGTPYESGQIFCQIVATIVAQKHPKTATITRSVRARGQKVYVDFLQNIEGKSLACAYSARASKYAGASTPLTWAEVDEGVDPRDFTIRTLPDRLASVGDLWAPLRSSSGVDLRKLATI